MAVAATSSWWVAAVDLIPASERPYIGGSTNNSALDLLLGYDGLGRILGRESGVAGAGGPGGGPGGAGGFGGLPGLLRLLNDQWAGQIAWLLPAAIVGLGAGLVDPVAGRRAPIRGAPHSCCGARGPWSTPSCSRSWAASSTRTTRWPSRPALAALDRRRPRRAVAGALADGVGGGRARRGRRGDGAARVAAARADAGLLAGRRARRRVRRDRRGASCSSRPPSPTTAGRRRSPGSHSCVGLATMLIGPALYSGETVGRAISGGDPSPGPATGSGQPGGGPGGFGGFGGGLRRATPPARRTALVAWLVAHRGDATWLVAVSSANQAGPLQLASGVPVMAMGGFMGTDPAPTLAQLQADVRDGRLRYVLLGGGPGGGPGGFFGGDGRGNVATERTQWVTDRCTPVTRGLVLALRLRRRGLSRHPTATRALRRLSALRASIPAMTSVPAPRPRSVPLPAAVGPARPRRRRARRRQRRPHRPDVGPPRRARPAEHARRRPHRRRPARGAAWARTSPWSASC